MPIRILDFVLPLAEEETSLKAKLAQSLRVSVEEIEGFKIVKKSLDARHKNQIQFVYSIEIFLKPPREEELLRTPPSRLKIRNVLPPTPLPSIAILRKPAYRPIVVGTGPAGLFAAMRLAEAGWPPLIVERGPEILQRVKDVEAFWKDGTFNPESNVQFGEGGAGTFSDGKLFTRVHDPRIPFILETFVRFGAPSEILYLQRPHIGTDRLRRVVANIREHLIRKGAEFRFQTKLTGLRIVDRGLQGVRLNEGEEIATSLLFLAIGHSARDTYQMLLEAGVTLAPKPFAMGLRVEHPQRLIDRIQYGPSAGHPRLPPAAYQLAYRASSGRAVFSFCMCPGGWVIGASSEAGCLVTNGMSFYLRNAPMANSALVVNVVPSDFEGEGPLAGVAFQRHWEKKAFALGGRSFYAPAQALLGFLRDQPDFPLGPTSFRPGITPARLDDCLPDFVARSLREALPFFNRKMPGFFSPEANLIGVETRTSAPVRILRNPDFESVSLQGLFPIGEGAGYAGGIVSSALDGLKAAETALQRLSGP